MVPSACPRSWAACPGGCSPAAATARHGPTGRPVRREARGSWFESSVEVGMGRWASAGQVSHKFALLAVDAAVVERCLWGTAAACWYIGRPCEPARRSIPWWSGENVNDDERWSGIKTQRVHHEHQGGRLWDQNGSERTASERALIIVISADTHRTRLVGRWCAILTLRLFAATFTQPRTGW